LAIASNSNEKGSVMGKWGLAVGSALLVSVASGAQANIILDPTPAGTGNNVVFNQQPANQSGTTIFGNINSNNTLVQFQSTQTLVTPRAYCGCENPQ
jgi:hypothetical protein